MWMTLSGTQFQRMSHIYIVLCMCDEINIPYHTSMLVFLLVEILFFPTFSYGCAGQPMPVLQRHLMITIVHCTGRREDGGQHSEVFATTEGEWNGTVA